MGVYIALVPILYKSTEYAPGAIIPADSPLLPAWLESGSVVLSEEVPEPGRKPKAKPTTAKPGRVGIAVPAVGEGKDLVGRVPEPAERGIHPEPRKRPGKKRQ